MSDAPAPVRAASLRPRLVRGLRIASHASAVALGLFLVVHLSAPATAAVAPPGMAQDWASKTMLLGRVYYQVYPSEPLLVWGSLGVHAVSSISKHLLLLSAPRRASDDAPPKHWRWPSAHTLSALALLSAVPVHALTTRVVPAQKGVSASLDHSFIARGFERWPLLSSALYGTLLCAGAIHIVGGVRRILRARPRQKPETVVAGQRKAAQRADVAKERRRRGDAQTAGAVGGVLLLLAGLTRIVLDGALAGPGTLAKFDACYAAVWPFRAAL